jgi:hypothetical protein
MDKNLVESVTVMNGELRIDHINGLITFNDGWSRVVLRITHLQEPIPDNVLIDIVALAPLTSYTPLQGEALGDKSGQTSNPEHVESFQEWIDEGIEPVNDDLVKFDMVCTVCRKVHIETDFFRWAEYSFIKGHEYIIWTRNGQQTYAHRGRMQFLGPSAPRYRLSFNARGPDRSHKGQYGDTQTLDARNIVKLEEVDIDPKKRYVDEIDRDMKRTAK